MLGPGLTLKINLQMVAAPGADSTHARRRRIVAAAMPSLATKYNTNIKQSHRKLGYMLI